jgi:signal transduction histidine kinase
LNVGRVINRSVSSLRGRIILVSALALVPILYGAHFVLNQLFVRQVTAQTESVLRVTLEQLAAGVVFDDPTRRLTLREPQGDPRWSKVYSGAYWQVNAPEGVLPGGVLRSRSLWDFVLTIPGDALNPGMIHIHRLSGPSGQQLLAAERTVLIDGMTDPLPIRLIAATDLRELNQAIDDFAQQVSQYLVVLAVVLVALLAVQLSVGLAPLRRLNLSLDRLRRGEAATLEGDFPAEVRPLADNLNGVVAQHRRHIERARAIAGNLAHALRTPLAVMSNASADQRASVQELRDLVAKQTTLAQKQVEWHLKRARMAATTGSSGQRFEISPVVDGIVGVMKRVYADKSLEIRYNDLDRAAVFWGEQQDLQEMLGNLIDNACKWARHRVVISATIVEKTLCIVVEDDGAGVAPDRYSEILKRGVRIDEFVPGTGLGLSIVAELVELYSGTLRFSSSSMGGLAAQICFPAEPR